jgi:hypothetical protein
MNALDTYLSTIAEGEMQKTASRESFREASFDDLAKAAGIKIAEDCCSKCGSRMEKLGSLYQCSCGMMKKAGEKCACGGAMMKTSEGYKCAECGAEKTAAAGHMSLERRENLPAKQFAVPAKKAISAGTTVKGESKGAYPIPDLKHARNALARVSQFGTPAEREMVRSKVYARYPELKTHFEAQHGESPTAGSNIKKVEQGGIGKSASKLTPARRNKLPSKSFAVPEAKAKKIGVASEIKGKAKGKYPIPDAAHARNALARVSRFGTPAEKSSVRAKVHSKYPGIGKEKESGTKLAAFYAAYDGDIVKMAAAAGMEKEALLELLGKYAPNLLSAGKSALRGMKAMGKGKNLLGMGKGLSAGQLAAQKGVATKAFGAAKGALGASQPAQLLRRAGQAQVGGSTLAQHAGNVGNWIKANPYKSMALAGGGGVLAGKTVLSSAKELVEVGDKAGRVLAKTAQSIPIDEIKESIQEAQDREDIPGRAHRWQLGGGLLGAASGALPGAGAGVLASKLLGRGGSALPIAGALLGGGLGAYKGQSLGKEYGAEEAAADKAVSLLRALRAHRAGERTGYGEGLQRGYAYGRGYGGEQGASE